MTVNKWAAIQVLIEEKLASLYSDQKRNESARDIVQLDQQSVGRLSRIDALQQQAMANAINLRQLHEQKGLKEALNRIKKNIYGQCLDCEEEIEIERLKARPTVLKCLECTKN
jgi:DnaK suppressor protein